MKVDLRTGHIELHDPGIILRPGVELSELREKSVVAAPEITAEMFRDSGMRIMEPLDFEKDIVKSAQLHTLHGMTVMLTFILRDNRLTSVALKNVDTFGDHALLELWDTEKKRHKSHRIMLARWLGPAAILDKVNKAWDFPWGRICTYYDEIYWGAAIFFEYVSVYDQRDG